MSSWEYKLISSGPLGFASMQLLEQHLNQLGKEEWEIIHFNTKPDNPLVFHGLARRAIMRDWFPPAAAKPAYVPPPIPPQEEEKEDDKDERSFADELPPARPVNAPAPAPLSLGNFDDLGSGGEEDLPTLFEALKPFLRKNPRGDQSVELDFLARKFEQDSRELLVAFAECGLKPPSDSGKGEVVDFEGSLYWLERDKKGRIWINTRAKKFKTVQATSVPAELEQPVKAQPNDKVEKPAGDQAGTATSGSFLSRIRSMMRRNRHGRGWGWSGSFQYMTKALKLNQDQLLEKLGECGLRLGNGQPPVRVEDEGFVFWLNRNQRGEIWINADEKRETRKTEESRQKAGDSAQKAEDREQTTEDSLKTTGRSSLPIENTLSAVRLLMEPKKRGEGVAAQVSHLAQKLDKSAEQLLVVLADAGLTVPESPKAKPAFAEQGGEIFWINVNAKGQVWLNAKTAPQRKKSRARKVEG